MQVKATNSSKCWNWTTTRLVDFGDKYYSTYSTDPVPPKLTIRKRVDTPFLFSAPTTRVYKFNTADELMKGRIKKLKCLNDVNTILSKTTLPTGAQCKIDNNTNLNINTEQNVKKKNIVIDPNTSLTLTESSRFSMFLYFCVAISFLSVFIINLREIQSFLLSKIELTDEQFESQVGFPRKYYQSICYILIVIICLFVVFISGAIIEFIRNDILPRWWKRYEYTYNLGGQKTITLQDLSQSSVKDGRGIMARIASIVLFLMFIGVISSFAYVPTNYIINDPGQTRFLWSGFSIVVILVLLILICEWIRRRA